MRAAIETAAQGAWVAEPEDQNTRVLRGLRLSLKDFDDRSKAYQELSRQHPRPDATLPNFSEDKQLLQSILDNAGISSKLALPTSTAILQEVRHLVPRTSVLSVWQLCSGFAHGRQWASDAVLKPKSRIEIGDGVVSKENRPTMKLFVWAMTAAMDLTRFTIQRYNQLAAPRTE